MSEKMSKATEKKLDVAMSCIFAMVIGLLSYHEWHSTVVGIGFYCYFVFASSLRHRLERFEEVVDAEEN